MLGFFYGPGTWYTREDDIGDQVRQRQVPIIGEGQGVYSFVHIDDAAGATAAALECPPGAYNIVDGNPSPQHLWLTAFARAAGAPAPPRVSEEEALRASGPDAVYYATRLRGASNEKAGRELEFRPRPLEWIPRSKIGLNKCAARVSHRKAAERPSPHIAVCPHNVIRLSSLTRGFVE